MIDTSSPNVYVRDEPLADLEHLNPRLMVLTAMIHLCGPNALVGVDSIFRKSPHEKVKDLVSSTHRCPEKNQMSLDDLKRKSEFLLWMQQEKNIRGKK